jgi:hypothetical protein
MLGSRTVEAVKWQEFRVGVRIHGRRTSTIVHEGIFLAVGAVVDEIGPVAHLQCCVAEFRVSGRVYGVRSDRLPTFSV